MANKQKTVWSNIIIKSVTENKIYENVDMDNDGTNDFVPKSFRENKVMTRLRDRFRDFRMLKVKEIDQFKKEIDTLKTEIKVFKQGIPEGSISCKLSMLHFREKENFNKEIVRLKEEIKRLEMKPEITSILQSDQQLRIETQNVRKLEQEIEKVTDEIFTERRKFNKELETNKSKRNLQLEKALEQSKKETEIERTHYDAVVEKNKRLLEMVNNEKLKTKNLENKLCDMTALYESLLETTY